MFMLYYKEAYIAREPLTANRTCQTWRGKQIAMCEEKEPLQEWINQQPHPEKFYIERQAY